jgi:Flp pilus assembly pilin Flp
VTRLGRMLRDVAGGTVVEYAVVFALFAVLAAVAFTNIAVNANTQYNAGTGEMTRLQESPLPAATP